MRLFLNQPIYVPSGQETPSDCTFTYTLTPKKKQQQQQIYCWSQLLAASLHEFIKRGSHTAISRKVVGKSARDNPERHCGWFWVLFFFFQRKLKELVRKAMQMCLRVPKESNKRRFDSYSRQEPCTDHIPYYLSGLSRAFSDNLSRNSCIQWRKPGV